MPGPNFASRLDISKRSFHQTATWGAASHFCSSGKSERCSGRNVMICKFAWLVFGMSDLDAIHFILCELREFRAITDPCKPFSRNRLRYSRFVHCHEFVTEGRQVL